LPNYWIIVERIDNWETDYASGFKQFGLPERKRKMASRIQPGDILVTYISSGLSMISDLRRVTDAKSKKLQFGGDYDTAFPIALQTEPMAVLEREKWIMFHELSGQLELTREKKDWRQTFRQSLLPLSENDGRLLVSCVKQASTTTNTMA